MTPETLKYCTDLLSGMLSPSQEWNKGAATVYAFALKDWADDVARAACEWAALNEKWRPAPVDLRAIAARMVAPVPPTAALLSEVRKLILHHGPRAGKAAHSSPLVALIADEMGGWECMGRLESVEMERGFGGAVERATRDYHAKVGEMLLTLPARQRQAAALLNAKPAAGLPAFPIVIDPPKPQLSPVGRAALEAAKHAARTGKRPPVIKSLDDAEAVFRQIAAKEAVS